MESRLERLRKLLKENNIDGVLISSLTNIIYFTDFSGFTTVDRDAYLLITKKKQYIFTHGIYKEAVQKHVPSFTLIDIKREIPISDAIKSIIEAEKIQRLGFEAFDLKVTEYERLTKTISKKLLKSVDLVGKLRVIKDALEIQAIKKACVLSDKAYSHILKIIRTGMTEKEVAMELELFIKRHGADISFPTIVAFGQNASMPHHVSTDIRLKRNDLVLIDFGVRLDNYCSDMTRTFFVGKATKKQKEVYEIVLEAQQKAIRTIQSLISNPTSSIEAKQIDIVVRDYIMSLGYPSIPHSLGHGIGIELHELPRLTPLSDDILEEGMVFSIEPGIYLPDEFGVRIEDLFAIENNKLLQLTKSLIQFTEI